MLIANPIYDVVFKKLMENERVAKFFIGTLLNATIEELTVRPQEFTYEPTEDQKIQPKVNVSVFRLDFIAIIKLENGEQQKVLIEIQKAGREVDLMRFRNYLGKQYAVQETVDGKKVALPIKTIYILGFKLPTIESPCLHIERQYRDLLTNEIIDKKSRFIESLTHDSYVVQTERDIGKYQTRLEKLLSIFEQSNFVDENGILKDYPYEAEEEEIKLMLDILQRTAADPKQRKKIEIEQEGWRSIHAMSQELERKLLAEMKEKDEILRMKNSELEEKESELEMKDSELEKKDEALAKALEELEELRKKMRGK